MVDDLIAETPIDFVPYHRATTAATWSLPSHASLFTGLYPWNHGCHNLAGLRPPINHPTIAGLLKAKGYSTASFSGNSVLAPETGLLSGFDLAAWGRWSENIFRYSASGPPHVLDRRSEEGFPNPKGQSVVAAGVATTLRHVPAVGYAISDLIRLMHGADGNGTPPVSPWIEPAFEAWVGSVRPERGLFSVVNLMDLHEPYLPVHPSARSLGGSLRFSFVPQDGRSYTRGQERPPADWIAEIRGLYSAAGRTLAGRIRGLWDTLRRHQRDRNTLFIVTSDHGQSLGENGWFFHSHGQTEDELTRVPLAVHYPDSSSAAAARIHANDWVSLIDVAPTIAEIAGVGASGFSDGVSLVNPGAPMSERTVLSAGDGPIRRSKRNGEASRRSLSNRTASCAAFTGETKWVVSGGVAADLEIRRYSAGSPGGVKRADGSSDPQEATAMGLAKTAVVSMLAAAPVGQSPDVSRRLATWGYG
ncbi:MAG: sulfatase-like hydrolase/transferase [Thermoplasmata archaeon]